MILTFLRILFGFKWEWSLVSKQEYANGTYFLFICKRSGRIKKVWMGEGF